MTCRGSPLFLRHSSLVNWALGISLFFLLTLSCHQDRVKTTADVLPNSIVSNFTLDESISGKRLYTLYARSAVVWDESSRIDVESLKVLFYDDTGAPYSELTAAEGAVNTRTENLIARGNVIVATADSTLLVTDSLAWDNTRRIIHTQAAVLITTRKGSVVGKGLIADANLSSIQIQSEVQGKSDYEF
jgi:LPS export ABC transporter protein LptC